LAKSLSLADSLACRLGGPLPPSSSVDALPSYDVAGILIPLTPASNH
jgi:hypothetical protein